MSSVATRNGAKAKLAVRGRGSISSAASCRLKTFSLMFLPKAAVPSRLQDGLRSICSSKLHSK